MRLLPLILLSFLLSACARFEALVDLKPIDSEPRVKFVQAKPVTVQPSQIGKVDPAKVITSYQRLLKRGNAKVRQEALRRLADLNMRFAEIKLTHEQPAELPEGILQASFAKAIQYYQQLLVEFPQYADVAAVKYQLARAYALNNESEKSLAIMDEFAGQYQQADTYAETQFRRGEAYFARGRYHTAELAYGEVIKAGEQSSFYHQALYKRGWSLFKQNLYAEGLEDFFLLLSRLTAATQANRETSQLDRELKADTLRVISLSFYNMEGPRSIGAYFAKHGRQPYTADVYDKLAELYLSQERYKDAADTYWGYIKSHPLSLRSAEFHSKIIDIYKKGGFPSLILPAKESFAKGYGKRSEFWQRHHQSESFSGILALLKSHLADIATFYHAKAQKSKKAKDYLIAADWYRQILDTYDDPKTDSRYRFAYAETLQAAGRWADAAKEYERVAYVNPPSKFSRDAGYRALVAYQNIQYPKQTNQLERLTPQIMSGLQFAKRFADDKETPGILARVAEQQLILKDIAGAIETAKLMLTQVSRLNPQQKLRAMEIVANGFFDLGRWAEAEKAISQLLQSAQLKSRQRKSLRERRAQALYKLAEDAQQNGRLENAVALYTQVYTLEPGSTVAINARYDAANLLMQLKRFEAASKILLDFKKQFPKHPLSQGIDEKLAFIYEQQQDWGKAAQVVLRIAESKQDKELKRTGLWQAAMYFEKAGLINESIRVFKRYAWDYPEPYLLAQEARQKLIDLYLKQGDVTKANFWRAKIVQFYAKNPQQNNERMRFLAAQAKYALTEPLFEQFKKIKLKQPLKRSLKRKKAAMKKALDAYTAIAKYKVAKYTTASTHRIGQLYQLLAADLLNSERPKGLNEEEIEEYGYLLEEQAFPFEEKAIELFEVNAERTAAGLYDDYIKQSLSALRKLKPAQYDKQEIVAWPTGVMF